MGRRLFVASAVRIVRPTRAASGDDLPGLDGVRIRRPEGDARVARVAIDSVPEAIDVPAHASLRDRDVERHDRARTREPGAPDGLVEIGLRRRARAAEADGMRVVDTSRSGCSTPSRRPSGRYGMMPPTLTPPTVTPNAIGAGALAAARPVAPSAEARRGGRRRRLGRLCRRGGPGARLGGEPERSPEADERAGSQERDAPTVRADGFHVCSVDVNMRGSFVTTASAPASSTRASIVGIVDGPRDHWRAARMRRSNAGRCHQRMVQATSAHGSPLSSRGTRAGSHAEASRSARRPIGARGPYRRCGTSARNGDARRTPPSIAGPHEHVPR